MNARNYIVVVTGMPRSGTSLMMQMLNAGGIPALTDNRRAPDAHNPLGYFEYEPVKSLARDASWVQSGRGKAVKIIYRLLRHLPREFEYRVVFMERELAHVFASQREMLRARGDVAAKQSEQPMLAAFETEIKEAQRWLASQRNIQILLVRYDEILENPDYWVSEVSRFLDGLDTTAMAACVNPALRHHG